MRDDDHLARFLATPNEPQPQRARAELWRDRYHELLAEHEKLQDEHRTLKAYSVDTFVHED